MLFRSLALDIYWLFNIGTDSVLYFSVCLCPHLQSPLFQVNSSYSTTLPFILLIIIIIIIIIIIFKIHKGGRRQNSFTVTSLRDVVVVGIPHPAYLGRVRDFYLQEISSLVSSFIYLKKEKSYTFLFRKI